MIVTREPRWLTRNSDGMVSEAVAEPPKLATARPTRDFLIVAIALLLVKLLLVSRREILTDQYDAEAYVSASLDDLRSVLGGDQFHPPGASWVMALARLLGIPYRIFIEIFFATAAFLFFRPLAVWTRLGTTGVTLLYALLLFHPVLVLEMDRAMSDPVSVLCWLAGAGEILGFVAASGKKFPGWSFWTGHRELRVRRNHAFRRGSDRLRRNACGCVAVHTSVSRRGSMASTPRDRRMPLRRDR